MSKSRSSLRANLQRKRVCHDGPAKRPGYLQRLDGQVVPGRRFFAFTVAGAVRAGLQLPAPQNEAETVTLDDYRIDALDHITLRRVHSYSMKDATIVEGDLVNVDC